MKSMALKSMALKLMVLVWNGLALAIALVSKTETGLKTRFLQTTLEASSLVMAIW